MSPKARRKMTTIIVAIADKLRMSRGVRINVRQVGHRTADRVIRRAQMGTELLRVVFRVSGKSHWVTFGLPEDPKEVRGILWRACKKRVASDAQIACGWKRMRNGLE